MSSRALPRLRGAPIEPYLIRLIKVVGVNSPEFSVLVARGSPERRLVVEDDADIEGIRVRDEPEQEPQDPAAVGADLMELDEEEDEEVYRDLAGFEAADDDLCDPQAASSSGAAPTSTAADALSAGVSIADAEEDAARCHDRRVHAFSCRTSVPAAGAVGDVPDWSGSGSEEIAIKEEVVYDGPAVVSAGDDAVQAEDLPQKHLLNLSPRPP